MVVSIETANIGRPCECGIWACGRAKHGDEDETLRRVHEEANRSRNRSLCWMILTLFLRRECTLSYVKCASPCTLGYRFCNILESCFYQSALVSCVPIDAFALLPRKRKEKESLSHVFTVGNIYEPMILIYLVQEAPSYIVGYGILLTFE